MNHQTLCLCGNNLAGSLYLDRIGIPISRKDAKTQSIAWFPSWSLGTRNVIPSEARNLSSELKSDFFYGFYEHRAHASILSCRAARNRSLSSSKGIRR